MIGRAHRLMGRWLLGVFAVATLLAMAVVALGWRLAKPSGVETWDVAVMPRPRPLAREEFWEAIRDYDIASATHPGRPPERRQFARALQLVVQGNREGAVNIFWVLHKNAEELRIREQSKLALARLLRAMARWDQLSQLDPSDFEARAYAAAPLEAVQFPSTPQHLDTRTGWLRIPRVQVVLNGRHYEFAIDTGADPSVITQSVAEECGIEVGDEQQLGATSTSHHVGWRAAIAGELRLGEVLIRNHRLAVVSDEALDFGLVSLDGILGWPIFEQMRVEIDYARGVTTLSRPTPAGSATQRNLFWLGYPVVQVLSREGVVVNLGLDTGARDTSLNQNILHKLPLRSEQGRRRLSIGAGGAEALELRRVPGFAFLHRGRQFRFDELSVKDGAKDLAVIEPDGRLGSDVAYGGKMIVDFARGLFVLDTPPRAP